MARIFVSFATPDLSLAWEIVGWLRADGHHTFLDRDAAAGIGAGDQWRQRLYQELRQVDAVVSVVTAASAQSTWCAAELGIADAMGCLVIPLRAQAGAAHPLLEHRQYVDYHADPRGSRDRVLAALRHLDCGLADRRWRDGENPFPGLEPFSPWSSAVFFGRAAEIRELGTLLRSPRGHRGGLLVIVGSSGCGKSSLLNAGLLPLLDREPGWLTTPPWVPGDEPLTGLAHALTRAAQRCGLRWSTSGVWRALAGDSYGLRRVTDDLLGCPAAARAQQLLIAVDQAEELFTRTGPAGREHVAALLRNIAGGPARPVLTLRSEFLDELRDLRNLEGVPVDAFVLPPLARDMLPAVIEGPARVAGFRLEPELVPRLVHDTGSGEALPLLAFTLQQLSEGVGRGGTLTIGRYAALGGVQGALNRHADTALTAAVTRTGLPEREVLAGLVRLVTIDDAGRWARRRVRMDRLPPPTRAALEVLVERRLLVLDATDGEGVVGVAHEALLTAWPPLQRMITEQQVALRAARAVEQAAADWQREQQADHYLWDETRLMAALTHLRGAHEGGTPALAGAAPMVQLNDDAVTFVHASRTRVQARQRRERRRRHGVLAALSTLLVLALIAAGLAVSQAVRAESGQRAAIVRALLAEAETTRNRDPRSALQLAAAARALDPRSAAAEANLIQTLAGARPLHRTLTEHTGAVGPIALSGDDRTLATGSDDGTVTLWDLTDHDRPGHRRPPMRIAQQRIAALALTADARLLAVSAGGPTELWTIPDSGAPQLIGRLPAPRAGSPILLSVTPDGQTLAESTDATVTLWDIGAPDRPRPLGEPLTDPQTKGTQDIRYWGQLTPDGRTLVLVAADTVILFDVTDREQPHELGRTPVEPDAPSEVMSVGFAADGRTLATTSASGLQVWNMTDQKRPRKLDLPPTLRDAVANDLTISPDGRTLAVSGNIMTLWDLAAPGGPQLRGRPLPALSQAWGGVTMLFSADGRTLVTGGTDRTAILWDVGATEWARALTEPLAGALGSFAPGDELLATVRDGTTVSLWNIADRDRPIEVGRATANQGDFLLGVTFAPDARTLATAGNDNSVLLWDITDPAQPSAIGNPLVIAAPPPPPTRDRFGETIAIPEDSVSSVQWLPDGDTLAVVQGTGVTFWDVTDRSRPIALSAQFGGPTAAASLSPDGTRLAILGVDPSLWDIADRASPRRLASPFGGWTDVQFLDPTTVVGTVNNAVTLWDLADPEQPHAHGQPFVSPVDAVAVSRDGRTLAAKDSETGTTTLWDLTDRARPVPLGEPVTGSRFDAVAFGPEDAALAVDVEGEVTLRDLAWLAQLHRDPDRPLREACARAGGPLTREDWDGYRFDAEYPTICPT